MVEAARFDLIIVGAGPAGLSAAYSAKKEDLSYLVLEKGLIANTVYNYPVGLTVFSTPNELEFNPGDLRPCREKPTREELLSYYVRFVLHNDLKVNTEEEVLAVSAESNAFHVQTSRSHYRARRVLFAMGGMERPRRLSVPGEELPKVHHRFVEAYPYVKKHTLVIGGGNSAAEAALFLAQEGSYTTLAIWRSDWENRDPKKGAIKQWVRTPLEEELKAERLKLLLFQNIEEFTRSNVRIRMDDGKLLVIENDAAFVLIGSDPDLRILKTMGVETTVSAGGSEVPLYNPSTFETNIQGIYVAGHFTNSRHIKDAIEVPRRVVPIIAQSIRTSV
jgi:thioredoxin reductase (NADPH)